MNRFEFATAGRIIFGRGVSQELGQVLQEGSRVFLVHGSDQANARLVQDILLERKCTVAQADVSGEPTLDSIQECIRLANDFTPNWVVSVGGGSAIDTGKATAGLLGNEGNILDYLEVVGKGLSLQKPGVPMIAVPTTAGTGSEVTRNAVIALKEQKIKVSLRSPLLLPWVALVDPDLTKSMPPELTASTGMDALAQVLEPFVSIRANPLADGFCTEGLQRSARSLVNAFQDGNDIEAREDMALASLMGGLALANAGLGTVHGFAAAIGGRFEAPHGAICARLLPGVVKANVAAMRQREPANPALARYERSSQLLTGKDDVTIASAIKWLEWLLEALKIPYLRSYGITGSDIPILVANTAAASSTKANPIKLNENELTRILVEAL